MNSYIDDLCINAIRMTSMHQINAAKSGHPGIALGAAPIIHTLFTRHLNADPTVTEWINRDRFVLSAGHGSSMLYSTLHLAGYDLSMDDLKNFRQLNSKTPGHPETHMTAGVDVSTGPLGQGLATAVGLAIASSIVAATYNKYEYELFDNYTYVLCGDGDLQEGVALEAMEIAGRVRLDKLVILYDSNDIQLDGSVESCSRVNVKQKAEAVGFKYLLVEDGTNVDALDAAIKEAKEIDQPTLIEIKTVIGHGSGFAGDCSAHGAPLGSKMTKELAENLEWTFGEFELPKEVYEHYEESFAKRGKELNSAFNISLSEYMKKFGDDHEGIKDFLNKEVKIDLSKCGFENSKDLATRAISSQVLNEICQQFPFVVGGSADLIKATRIHGPNGTYNHNNQYGKNILFGVREHAMGAIANGISLFGGLVGLASTFLAFSDYTKASMRMAALMNVPTVYVYSHDSLAVGEDGPTHQPIEQLVMLRSIPNFNVMRPCDGSETAQSMKLAFESKNTPSAIITSRQVLPMTTNKACDVSKGAYVIQKEKGTLNGVIIATGSEVSLAMQTADLLSKEGLNIRVVSMPSMYLFEKQKDTYKENILPKGTPVIALEMAHPMSWYKYTPNVYGVEEFGISAPAKDVLEHFGFTVDKFSKYVKTIFKK
ncbi:MAG: transketolase [bacterium]